MVSKSNSNIKQEKNIEFYRFPTLSNDSKSSKLDFLAV